MAQRTVHKDCSLLGIPSTYRDQPASQIYDLPTTRLRRLRSAWSTGMRGGETCKRKFPLLPPFTTVHLKTPQLSSLSCPTCTTCQQPGSVLGSFPFGSTSLYSVPCIASTHIACLIPVEASNELQMYRKVKGKTEGQQMEAELLQGLEARATQMDEDTSLAW